MTGLVWSSKERSRTSRSREHVFEFHLPELSSPGKAANKVVLCRKWCRKEKNCFPQGNPPFSLMPRRVSEDWTSCKSFCLCIFKHSRLEGFLWKGLFGVFLSSGRSCVFELQVPSLESEQSMFGVCLLGAGLFKTPWAERKHQRYLRLLCARMQTGYQNHSANLNCFRQRSVSLSEGFHSWLLKWPFFFKCKLLITV